MPDRLQQRASRDLGERTLLRHERSEDPSPRSAVTTETLGRALDVPVGDARPPAVEGMREGDLGDHEVDALLKPEGGEERRGESHGMHGGADVVSEPGKRGLGCARTAPDGLPALEHRHRQSRSRQGHGRGEPVGSCTDDHGIHCTHTSECVTPARLSSAGQPHPRKRAAQLASASTESTLPAGSRNQAMSGPKPARPRAIPFASVPSPGSS
jgi:hypothetical protein